MPNASQSGDGKLTLEQLEAFVVVAELGSCSDAAASLGGDRTRIWHLIRRLEGALGVDLIERQSTRGRVQLGATGSDLLPQVRKVLTSLAQLRESAATVSETHLAPAVKVTCYPAHLRRFIDVFDQFAQSDSVRIEFVDIADRWRDNAGAEQIALLHRAVADVVIAPAGLGGDGVAETPLYRWQLVAVTSIPAAATWRGYVTPRELSNHPLLLSPAGHSSRDLLEAAFAPGQLPLRTRIESSDVALLLDFASRGMGVAVLPDDSIYPYAGPAFPVRRGAKSPLGGSHAAYSRADAEPPTSDLVKQLAQYSPWG